MSDKRYKSTDLTPEDQDRLQVIIDKAATGGVKLDFPKAIRVAMSAWESMNLPRKGGIAIGTEAHENWQREQIDKQLNPLED